MKTRFSSLAVLLSAVGLASSACSSPDVETHTNSAASLEYEPIPTTIPHIYCNPFGTSAAPAGAGLWPVNTGAWDDATVCRDCTFTDGSNLGPGVDDHIDLRAGNLSSVNALLTQADSTHLNKIWDHDPCSTAQNSGSNFRQVMRNALSEATSNVNVSKAWVSDAASVLQKIADLVQVVYPGLSVTTENDPPTYWAVAFKPNRWRFKSGELINPTPPGLGWFYPPPAATPYFYHPYPTALTEARFRGARSYCAMRQAASAQAATGLDEMGELSLSHGETWLGANIGVARASIHVAKPEKRTSDPGANVFLMPIQLRTQTNVIAGKIFPKVMPESAHEIVWVSGDSEYVSNEDYGTVYSGGGVKNIIGLYTPFTRQDYRKFYLNGEHSDIFVGQSRKSSVTLHGVVPILADWLSASATIHVGIELGTLVAGNADDNGRVLASSFPGFAPARTTYWDDFVSGSPAPWIAKGEKLASDSPFVYDPYNVAFGLQSGQWSFLGGFGIFVRAAQNDDRSVVIKDAVEQSFGADVTADFDLGLVRAAITVGGSISGTATYYTVLREQVSVVNPEKFEPAPLEVTAPWTMTKVKLGAGQTNLVVNGRGTVEFNAGLNATMTLKVNLGFYSKTWQKKLNIWGTNIDDHARYPESSRLRVGQFSDFGLEFAGGIGERNTYSHLPDPSNVEPTTFTSFPDDGLNNTVEACLGNDPSIDDPPAPRDGEPGEPLVEAMCVKGPPYDWRDDSPYISYWMIPSDVCAPGQIDHYLNDILPTVPYFGLPNIGPLDQAKRDCMEDFLTFMCAKPNKWVFGTLSRVMSASPVGQPKTPDQIAFDDIFGTGGTCFNAFVVGPTDTERATQADFLVNYLHPIPQVCEADGTPLEN